MHSPDVLDWLRPEGSKERPRSGALTEAVVLDHTAVFRITVAVAFDLHQSGELPKAERCLRFIVRPWSRRIAAQCTDGVGTSTSCRGHYWRWCKLYADAGCVPLALRCPGRSAGETEHRFPNSGPDRYDTCGKVITLESHDMTGRFLLDSYGGI